MKAHRRLNITVTVSGQEAADGSYSATASYQQTPSDPPMDGAVDPKGEINLDVLHDHPNFFWKVRIHFTLVATVYDRNGTIVPCTWATTADAACKLTGPGRGPATGMEVKLPTTTEVVIHNDNDDRHKIPKAERTYTYKLGVILPTLNDYPISLDPRIFNTGPPGFGFFKLLKVLGLLGLIGMLGRLLRNLIQRLFG